MSVSSAQCSRWLQPWGQGPILPEHLVGLGPSPAPAGADEAAAATPPPNGTSEYHRRVEAFRRKLVSDALEDAGGGVPDAAAAVETVLGRSGGTLLANRLTPLFQLFRSTAGDYASSCDRFS